jgi:hypothetical protein
MYMNKIKNPNLLLAWICTDSVFWKKRFGYERSLDVPGYGRYEKSDIERGNDKCCLLVIAQPWHML